MRQLFQSPAELGESFKTISPKLVVSKFIGHGQTAQVYEITDAHSGRLMALKVFAPKDETLGAFQSKVDRLKQRFENEAKALFKIRHPHVIIVFSHGIYEKNGDLRPYFIMEKCDCNLKEFLGRQHTKIEDIIDAFLSVCAGLGHLHFLKAPNGELSRIIHRDLKPENILLGNDGFWKVSDLGFGLLYDFLRESPISSGTIIGTYPYAAPEQLDRERRIDYRADIFALGKILELDIIPKLREFGHRERSIHRLMELASRMSADNPDERPKNTKEVAHIFENAILGERGSERLRALRYTKIGGADGLWVTSLSIRIRGETNALIGEKIAELLDAPEIQKLKSLKQLYFVDTVYPGATHSRFEHSIGIYQNCRTVLQSLLRDPWALEHLDKRSVESVLISTLIHDVGHYPFCHFIEEMANAAAFSGLRIFSQEALTRKILSSRGELTQKIIGIFGEEYLYNVKALLIPSDSERSTLSEKALKLLRSMIDGGIDCDKIDYLELDATHCGVPYGKSFDKYRLMSSLTIDDDPMLHSEGHPGPRLGLTEKGKAPAEMFLLSRYIMFTEVYWHHCVRALIAMFKRAMADLFVENRTSALKALENIANIPLQGASAGVIEREALGILISESKHRRTKIARELFKAILERRPHIYKRIYTFPPFVHEPESQLNPEQKEIADLHSRVIEELRGPNWLNFLKRVNQRLGTEDPSIIVDVPLKKPDRREIRICSMLGEEKGAFLFLREASPIAKRLFDLFDKDATRKIRVFCRPELRDSFIGKDQLIIDALNKSFE